MKRVHVDANAVLRFLRNDDPVQSPQAAALLQRGQTDDELELVVSAVTLMEIFHVLTRAYDLPRTTAAGLLAELLQTGALTCPDGATVEDALGRITGQKISFGDAYLAAAAAAEQSEVASFDHGMAAFPDIRSYPFSPPAKRGETRRKP
jgi:predicted nucleic acid-binding protein